MTGHAKKISIRGWPKEWPRWVRQIAAEMEATEPTDYSLVERPWPAWLKSILKEIVPVAFPTVRIVNMEQNGTLFVGRLVGHTVAMLRNEQGLEKVQTGLLESLETLEKQLRETLAKKAYARLQAQGAAFFEKHGKEIEKLVSDFETTSKRKEIVAEKALETANRRPPSESADFFKGFEEGLRKGTLDEDGQIVAPTTTHKIYMLLAFAWLGRRKFYSVTELHVWLCGLLGKDVVGNLDRVKQICTRHEIRFRMRGRPRKRKK